MTVKELIEDLSQYPEDAKIIVSGGYYGGVCVENWEPQSFEYYPTSNDIVLTQEKDLK